MHGVILNLFCAITVQYAPTVGHDIAAIVDGYSKYLEQSVLAKDIYCKRQFTINRGESKTKGTRIISRMDESYMISSDIVTDGASTEYYVYGRNGKYQFELSKNRSGNAIISRLAHPVPAILDSINGIGDPGAKGNLSKRYGIIPYAVASLTPTMSVYYYEICHLASMPNFTVNNVSHSGDHVIVTFTYKQPSLAGNHNSASGLITLNARCNYRFTDLAVSSGDKVNGFDLKAKAAITKDQNEELTKIHSERTSYINGIMNKFIYSENVLTRSATASDFLLCSYGFDEPFDATRNEWHIPWFVWLSCLGILILLYAVWLSRSKCNRINS